MQRSICGLAVLTLALAACESGGPEYSHRAEFLQFDAYICTDSLETVESCLEHDPADPAKMTGVNGRPVIMEAVSQPVADADNRVYMWLYLGDGGLIGYDAIPVPDDGATITTWRVGSIAPGISVRANFQMLLIENNKAVEVAADTTFVWR